MLCPTIWTGNLLCYQFYDFLPCFEKCVWLLQQKEASVMGTVENKGLFSPFRNNDCQILL